MQNTFNPDHLLSHLTFIKKEKLTRFVDETNRISKKDIQDRKLVIALGTGGTISMRIENGIGVPDLDFEGMFRFANPILKDHFVVKSLDLFQIDSSQMIYAHVRDMAIAMIYIWHRLTVPFIGFFVPHGTDTMSYSSAAISLMMGQGLPFSAVFTGAQKPIQEPMNDANSNIRNALYTLASLHDNAMAEIVVVMGNKAILATSSEKIDDIETEAFDAPLHKFVARFGRLDYPVRIASWLKPKRDVPFEPVIIPDDYGHTLVVRSVLGLNPAIVKRQAMDPDIRAVILYSYGATTFENTIIDTLAEATQHRKIPLFYISPVNAEPRIGYESGLRLKEKGAHPLYMTLSSALAKIEIAFHKHPGDLDTITDFVTTNYVGEIPSESSRYY